MSLTCLRKKGERWLLRIYKKERFKDIGERFLRKGFNLQNPIKIDWVSYFFNSFLNGLA